MLFSLLFSGILTFIPVSFFSARLFQHKRPAALSLSHFQPAKQELRKFYISNLKL